MRSAVVVASAIFLSRIAGFVRESIFAAYLGNSASADAFRAALRIPNLLQNLFGEGVLSASFIPVYSSLLGKGCEAEARSVARRVGAVLLLVSGVVAAVGITFASSLVDFIAPGFAGETRALAIVLVQIFFPGTALLVLSAWCLGILNSHRRFFLSYAAPVIWNAAIIAALLIYGASVEQNELAIVAAWGLVVGSFLQFVVQFAPSLRYLKGPGAKESVEGLRTVWKNFLPVVFGRGVVQISAFVDSMIASCLPVGSVAALGYAQILYLLPVSLFGMSVSAAELPELSRAGSAEALISRLRRGIHQIVLFVVPTTFGFLVAGDLLISALYERGAFQSKDTVVVAVTLAALALALPASTSSRLLASAFYAVHETKAPVRIAVVRVVVSSLVGAVLALRIAEWMGIPDQLSLMGLSLGSVLGAWLEWALLRRAAIRRFGVFEFVDRYVVRVVIASAIAALILGGARLILGDNSVWVGNQYVSLVLAGLAFGLVYVFALLLLLPEAVRALIGRVRKGG